MSNKEPRVGMHCEYHRRRAKVQSVKLGLVCGPHVRLYYTDGRGGGETLVAWSSCTTPVINPLIGGVMMDEVLDAERVTINQLDNELARRGLSTEIYPHATEWEVRVRDPQLCTSTVCAPTLLEALIDAMNDHWTEYKR